MVKVFKKDVLDRIKSDPDLYALVSKAVGVKPSSLAAALDRNGNSVNQYHVVKAVAEYMEVDPEDIIEPASKEAAV